MPGIEDALADAGATPEWMEIESFFERKDRTYAKSFLEEQAKYEKFHEDTRQGIHACQVQRAAVVHLDERLSELVVQVDKDIRDKVRHQRQERHTMETRLEKLVEEKVVDVRGLMMEEQKSRQTGDVYTKEVTNEVCHLYNDLEEAKNYRLQKSEKLQEVVSQKLDEISVAVAAEKKIREEQTHSILELFGQMGTKMQMEIDSAKAERKESTDRLIQLMEVVLPHLEQARINQEKLVKERAADKQAVDQLAADLGNGNDKRLTRKSTKFSMVGNAKPGLPAVNRTMTMDSIRKSLPVLKGLENLQEADES